MIYGMFLQKQIWYWVDSWIECMCGYCNGQSC